MKKLLLYMSIISGLLFQSCINDNEDPIPISGVGDVISPNVGGATQPNQVWFDLSSGTETINNRTDWDLGFYNGSQFKVVLNSSIMMAAAKIPNATNIDAVNESDVTVLKTQVQVANFDPNNVNYIDTVTGEYATGYTAISEIAVNDADNAIYLINMGKNIYAGDVPIGSVATGGEDRGWMKIQVVRNGNGYKVKYATLNETNHQEYIITKNSDYNFNFFSLKNNNELLIQPGKHSWDLCFTVFTNVITGAGTYIYADFVLSNILGGVAAYEVKVTAPTTGAEAYNNFTKNDIDISKFITNDQRAIGANWRNPVGTNGLETYGDRFYVVRDAEGYYFKIRFTRMTSTEGVRGYPQFEYKPL
ncbi:HmuY family protein [Epilithonimonas sp.]|uniref:HmuY family protein n=1 Tax=Epilithonimonas sp. TaxID=2894511 RepID=UPI00289D946B|nr:HmuY family protein [Epilithonimonas sp.]